ncbi:hypothetical protein ACS0TY_029131 [Phlomoides rotata]
MRVSLAFIILCFFITFNVNSSDPTHFTDDVSINCGSTATSSANSGRQWLGDVQPRASPLLQLKGLSTTSTASSKSTSADQVPYKTARVSRSWFSYAFRVNSGQIIIRLHFNPSAYRGFKGLKDLFTVEAGSFTLLSNFSASLTADVLGVNSLTREYCLNIQENQLLDITFSAETSQSKDAYAFINGIEIISVPAGLSYFHGRGIGLQVVGRNSLVHVDDSIALEMIYRQNIKQADDSGDIFGIWPRKEVGNINNVTWKVSVDVGFRYLVRLHFSKLGLKMAETGGLNFKVYINEMIADTNTDIVDKERDGRSIPWHGDCIVMMNGRKQEGKRDLLIRLQSNDEFMDGVLKGFEILKLSNPDNSLASPIPIPPSRDLASQTIQNLLRVLVSRNAIGSVAITILSIVCFIVHKLREISEASPSEAANRPSARAERLCRRFSLSEMQLATRNFSDGLLIGKGGFGKVYKGLIDNEQNTVAVKRLKPNSNQGAREFLTEIETLSELRHINLVSLIGYCSEGREMILVYEYMARGTLGDHLYNFARRGVDASSLTWKQRLDICIGAARGLDYLHTGHRIIHRDVKASNILLDDSFVAKVSDFGLAKAEDRSKSQSHVSTKVKGTYGYLDPYYYSTRKLTRKSDTYAFGVVLLEVLCGRAAVDFGVPEEERMLTMWAKDNINKGEVNQIVASSLRDEILANSQKTFFGIIESCLHDEPKNRPTMSQVVLRLELALEQQDSNLDLGLDEIASVSDEIHPSNGTHIFYPVQLQPTVDSIYMQNHTLTQNEQTNNKVVISGKIRRGKPTRNKTSRLWLWDAFWNRVKPSKKSELLLSVEESIAEDVNLPKFDWDLIVAATNNFSSSNIVGRGRFGGVYKAVLPSGDVVAVKRRLLSSSEGLDEFKNEMHLLPRLRHRNIIKLCGYCMGVKEFLLVYEFMENTSLDCFIDKGQIQLLQWAVRFQMIMGIARGLVYLHPDSGLRAIHGDLNLSSILLDLNMNPIISDFDVAMSTLEFQTEIELGTSGIKATHGYMPPEYYMDGKVSVKSDVYSFGIILLEVVSGRRLFSLYLSRSLVEPHMYRGYATSNGDDYTWMQWNERRAIDLVYDSLGSAFPEDEVKRCIDVARLCIQGHPDQRPLMSSVIKMLQGNEQIKQLPLRSLRQVPAGISENAHVDNDGLDNRNATFELDDTLESSPREVLAGISENAYFDNDGVDNSNATFELDVTLER